MTGELSNQIDKVMCELRKLHEMLPTNEQTIHFDSKENNIIEIGQTILTSIVLAEATKEIVSGN